MSVDSYTYIKYNRSELARSLLTKPIENHLLCVIAQRVRYKDDPVLKLKSGQCFIGDYSAIGLTRQSYRTALKNLISNHLITTKPTNRGTIVTLINSDIYDINTDPVTTSPTKDQPSANHQPTISQPLNKNDKNDKNDKNPNTSPVVGIFLPDFIDQSLWDDFILVRKKLKAINSDRAINALINKLVKFNGQGYDANKIIETSVVSSWKDLYEPKDKNNSPTKSTTTKSASEVRI